jgi:hypothetical protein
MSLLLAEAAASLFSLISAAPVATFMFSNITKDLSCIKPSGLFQPPLSLQYNVLPPIRVVPPHK